ncbi:MAG: molybdenum cofactor guanylyltransferase [Acidobacteriota bacterium]|nr:molybdenum cofactor guanylyltransferase [Acidobacteriota bacterium]
MSSPSAPVPALPHSSQRPVGVVLAGGASRRLGRDKTRLEIDGETLVARAARKLTAVCSRVLVADGGRGLLTVPVPSIADGPGAGPVAGILGAARACPGEALLVLACDLPLVPVALLEALVLAPKEADWALPFSLRHEELRPEPLCARYGPRAVVALSARVARGELALHPLAEEPGLEIHRFEPEELRAWGNPAHLLLNVNRPRDVEDLESLQEKA